MIRYSLPKTRCRLTRRGCGNPETLTPWIARYGISGGVDSEHSDVDCNDGQELSFVSKLERNLPLYLAVSRGFNRDCSHGDVGEFTEAVLGWWKNHGSEL